MKLKLLIVLLIALLPMVLLAQGGSLTIYSEDGEKFTLYLNGMQQNSIPQTNLRIDGLTEPNYTAKMVFEVKNLSVVEKNITLNDAATNKPADVVYKMKKKGGEMKLRLYSMNPALPGNTVPADVYVVHYGQPEPAKPVVTNVINTPGVNQGNGGVGISIISQDQGTSAPPDNATNQTTTTSGMSFSRTPPPPPPAHSDCAFPMDANSFKNARQTIAQASFEDTKMQIAQSVFSTNCLSSDQVVQICQLFGFEDGKLKFAKYAYSRTTDQANYARVVKALTFELSKADLNQFIANGGR
jgi:hypothetical protein